MGGGVLVEFESALWGIECAVEREWVLCEQNPRGSGDPYSPGSSEGPRGDWVGFVGRIDVELI